MTVERHGSFKILGMISVTNNVTQEVTLLLPTVRQRERAATADAQPSRDDRQNADAWSGGL